MPQRASLQLPRQQLEKFAEVGFVELLGGRELPQHRAEPVAQFQHAGIVEAFHRIAGFREHPGVGREARPLQREYETVRHFAGPFAETLGLLRSVIGAVDLDRGQFGGGVFEFLRLRQLFRIENAAPWRERPAADPDVDVACLGCHVTCPLRNAGALPISLPTAMLKPPLHRRDDHEMARLRRMYARHVVRGRWHFWPDFQTFPAPG